MNPPIVTIRKRKLNTDYDNLSKEELLNIIHGLEKTIEHLRKPKSPESSTTTTAECEPKRQIDFSKYNKRHIALKIVYLGWNYDGFVVQKDTINTIENHLFLAFTKGRLIENRTQCNYHRCGRTDQGVSSFSQVISLTVRSRLKDTSSCVDELPYCKILNGLLPKDIRVIAWASVPEDFSARFSCKMRTYKYWFPRGDLNVEEMNEGIQSIIGSHDFRNLCKMDVANGVVHFKRRIHQACVTVISRNQIISCSDFDMCEMTIVGEAFLWHQIRFVVSVLFLIGQGKEKRDIFEKLLDVDKYPRKPQYALSSPLPLNLFHCEFEGISWIIDQDNLTKIISSLQSFWTAAAVKCSMLESMIKHCAQLSTNFVPIDVYSVLFKDVKSRIYKPLLSRTTGQSLEDRISHYMKKGKLELKATDAGSNS